MIQIFQTASNWEERDHLRFTPTAQIGPQEALESLQQMLNLGWEVFSIEFWGSLKHVVGVRQVDETGIVGWQRFWGPPDEMRPLFEIARQWRALHPRSLN